MGLIKYDQKGLLSSSYRQVLCPEQHVVNHAKHGANNSGEHLRWETGNVEYRYRLVMPDPVSDEGIQIALNFTVKIGFITAAG